jgi:hypothetical protein
MVLLLGVPDNFGFILLATLLGNAALNGFTGGFLAWLIGSSGRQGRLGIGGLLAIGAAASALLCLLVVLIAPTLLFPILFESPGTIMVSREVFLSLPFIAACTLAALAVNVWHARKSRR